MNKEQLLNELVETFVKDDAPDWIKEAIRVELDKIVKG